MKEIGDAYTFIGLDRSSKLVVAWPLGKRDQASTDDFISKVRWATSNQRFDICTDGFSPYVYAIDAGLHDRADYSQVVKVYSKQEEGRERYSPGAFVSVEKKEIFGAPNLSRASTSHVERKNGTLRQWCKRLTRLTYAFSKKWNNLKSALALTFRTLQLLQRSRFTADHASDGSGDHGPRLEHSGTYLPTMTPLPKNVCAPRTNTGKNARARVLIGNHPPFSINSIPEVGTPSGSARQMRCQSFFEKTQRYR